jgi:SWI/SNF-related matrix-associated actin-dependent regulator 1 of chromatin subfamily A
VFRGEGRDMLRISFTRGSFRARCDFESRLKLKGAGFRWDGESWYTENPKVAARLREHADESARNEIDRRIIHVSPWLAPLPIPSGLELRPFQVRNCLFALGQSRSYLAADPGLGKGVMAVVIRNALKAPTVYVCPPFLTLTVEAEFRKWSVGDPAIERLDPWTCPAGIPDVLIVPDSLVHRDEVQREIREMVRWAHLRQQAALLFVDEAHRYKSSTTLRTKALLSKDGLYRYFERQVWLSGTPMPNGRPMELYPLLSRVAPETIDFKNKFDFGMDYCEGYHDGFGYDFNGGTEADVKRLEEKIRPFMLRTRKAEALPELPPKTEELVLIGSKPAKLAKLEAKILREHAPEDLMAGRVSSDHVSTYRRELGSFKMKSSLDFIRSLLRDSDESIIVFAFHKDVISGLKLGLKEFSPLVIDGESGTKVRHETAAKFQSGESRLLVANYVAAGVGFTLTRATRVVFVEFSWVPAENDQASDRAHRIGQRDHVFVQYLVFENSIDRKVMETNLRKRKLTAQI